MQFPQPTRPINSYDLESLRFPQEQCSQSQPVNMDNNCESCLPAETTFDSIQSHDNCQTSMEELYEKLPDHQWKVDKDTKMRGVNGPLDELQQKLERFKIKTVQLGGVIKQEEKDDQKR
ncbi:hypothetical protein JRO89_XS12G0009000 [Xanthoceras sorbifolium]|uniref:Uncharacterized protein n=1 Tax=Xanthoceras sorbifolium TaxID=99658 RepID=A0ABQ8HA92_9ROSI|nr:hypothetical protein JRO89_XS12G0009000 [Xanthoceras sorbifolium]